MWMSASGSRRAETKIQSFDQWPDLNLPIDYAEIGTFVMPTSRSRQHREYQEREASRPPGMAAADSFAGWRVMEGRGPHAQRARDS